MNTYVMVHGSTEYRRVQLTVLDVITQAPVDPTSHPVKLAFMTKGSIPTDTDWHDATWVTSGSTYYAKILIGPVGGLDLGDSDYWVYARVDAGIEFPVMLAGKIEFK